MLMITAPSSISNYFNLIQVGESRLRSEPPYCVGTLDPDKTFGGLLVSQAVSAFTALFPKLIPHTINYKFIAPVKINVPIEFEVNPLKDVNIASISIYQSGKHVGTAHLRFALSPDFLDSSSFVSPEYGSHSDYPNTVELVQSMRGQIRKMTEARLVSLEFNKLPLEIKPVESPYFPYSDIDRLALWLRFKPEFQDSLKTVDGLAVALFISDFLILLDAMEIYQKSKIKIKSGASLHHSVWIHDAELDPLGWYLTVVECEVISYGRVRLESRVFNENRKCVLTVVQEGYMQRMDQRAKL